VKEQLLWLLSIFAIDVWAYAVVSNHVRSVLCMEKDKTLSWADKEVLSRWYQLYKSTLLSQKFTCNTALTGHTS
jgi:hypothetical protein